MGAKSATIGDLGPGAVGVTEAAAIAAARLIGRGDEKAADGAAVDAMRSALGLLDIDGTVVIGEGERDEAPMLFTGEKVGAGAGLEVGIAVDPLEGTTITAKGGPGALSVLALAASGHMLQAPDVYMDKIAVGGGLPEGIVDLDASPADNLAALAEARGVKVSEIMACILDRPRHADLIAAVRAAGARINLIPDGDIAGVIAATDPATGVDIYMGIGGAPEGVLAAAALRCIGGQIQGRLVFRNEAERERARRIGIKDLRRKYLTSELAGGDVIFAATGVTDGPLLDGVKFLSGAVRTHSLLMDSRAGTLRRIQTRRKT
jgi:fructose-1,6-bisphosphatase II / sedoheptulose-1,7-bisphosphatase